MLTSGAEQLQDMSLITLENELREKGMPTSVLKDLRVKSKKKRIQQKVLKKVMGLISNIEQKTIIELNVVAKTKVSENKQFNFDLTKVPVMFLLKIGKKYFENESIFKFYYNERQKDYYKNIELLISTLETEIPRLNPSLQEEVSLLLNEQRIVNAIEFWS